MKKRSKLTYPIVVIVALVIFAIAGYALISQFDVPANIISSEYITITATTFDDGDIQVNLEILEPANIRVNGWASWVKFADGTDSDHKSENTPGVHSYTVPNIYPQKVTIFLQVSGEDTLFNEYFLDTFFKTYNHQPVDLIIVENTTVEIETQTTGEEPEFVAKDTPINIVFSLLAIPILIKWRKHND